MDVPIHYRWQFKRIGQDRRQPPNRPLFTLLGKLDAILVFLEHLQDK